MIHYLNRILWWQKRYNKGVRFTIQYYSGFFPRPNVKSLDRFSKIYLDSSRKIDCMGLMGLTEEATMISKICPDASLFNMKDVLPLWYSNPWSKILEGKQVLVIHPFTKDIEEQYYNKRTLLFDNPNILPNFELKTIRAIQRNSSEQNQFNSWFEVLWYMKGMIKATEFDIALIGCGAYGLPIGSYIKEELQKPAIHLASGVQILFGLQGRRWHKTTCLRHLFNEHWIYPSDNIGDDSKVADTDVYSK